MLSYISLTIFALIATYIFNVYRAFAKNLADAKSSNIPYIIIPFYTFNRAWMISSQWIQPQLRKLPKSWTSPWIDVLTTEWPWEQQYTIFQQLKADTFLTVSSGGNTLWTADANVVNQITTRRNDFPKPIRIYKSVDIYGKNVVTTEGQNWRHHRKITSPPFTEKNNHLVWNESLHQAQAMVRSWMGADGEKSRTINTVSEDSMRLSLHIISRSGFGVRLQWPGEVEAPSEEIDQSFLSKQGVSGSGKSAGHTMTYTDALGTLLHNILFVMLIPKFLLINLPFKRTKKAYESYIEWGKYMNEMVQARKKQVSSGNAAEEQDLMGALVKGSGITSETPTTSSTEKSPDTPKQALTDDEVLGNAFVFILAGHETTANAIYFSLLFLAMQTSSQRHLQADLEEIFAGRSISQWDYDRDLPKLFGGMAGAVLAEELRLVPPIIAIPKSTQKDSPQSLTIDGKKCVVPGDTLISLCASAIHRNPQYFPAGPPSDLKHPVHPTSNPTNDLEEFRPERWLLNGAKDAAVTTPNGALVHDTPDKSANTDDLGVNTAADTAATLFKPIKGSYIPFSEGYRACIGRRFAQVEVLAVLAVVFSQYSVELAVDEWATDAEVEEMTLEKKRLVWNKAKARAMWLMRDGMSSIITIQMRKGVVPVRLVRKGEERFAGF